MTEKNTEVLTTMVARPDPNWSINTAGPRQPSAPAAVHDRPSPGTHVGPRQPTPPAPPPVKK